MQRSMKHKAAIIVIFIFTQFIFYTTPPFAHAGFEFYFFGLNIKSFKNSNWLNVAAGAVASVCMHELGHALYLESIGKSYDFRSSLQSGFCVYTSEDLTDTQWRNFGRAGFALQALVGTGLTLFDQTRHADFTKGWVAFNALQVLSYQGRHNENDGDFALIERGGGNRNMEHVGFSLLSIHTLVRLEDDIFALAKKAWATPIPSSNFSYTLAELEDDGQGGLISDATRLPSLRCTLNAELPAPDPQNGMEDYGFWSDSPQFAGLKYRQN